MNRSRVFAWLAKRAENVAVLLLSVMFGAFILQVVFRYLLNLPSGWAQELTVDSWLWLVLFGAAFVLREDDEIRFDFLYGSMPLPVRRVMLIIAGLALIVIYGVSLPAVWDFVTFMKIQSTSYLGIRYDVLFSIYVIFSAAMILRYGWLIISMIRKKPPLDDKPHPQQDI